MLIAIGSIPFVLLAVAFGLIRLGEYRERRGLGRAAVNTLRSLAKASR